MSQDFVRVFVDEAAFSFFRFLPSVEDDAVFFFGKPRGSSLVSRIVFKAVLFNLKACSPEFLIAALSTTISARRPSCYHELLWSFVGSAAALVTTSCCGALWEGVGPPRNHGCA